jgi:hypothetical protein
MGKEKLKLLSCPFMGNDVGKWRRCKGHDQNIRSFEE